MEVLYNITNPKDAFDSFLEGMKHGNEIILRAVATDDGIRYLLEASKPLSLKEDMVIKSKEWRKEKFASE